MKHLVSSLLLPFSLAVLLGSCAPEPTAVTPPEKALIHNPSGKVEWTGKGSMSFQLALNCGCSFIPHLSSSMSSGDPDITIDTTSFATMLANYDVQVKFNPPTPTPGVHTHTFIFSAPDNGVNNEVTRILYDTVVVNVTI